MTETIMLLVHSPGGIASGGTLLVTALFLLVFPLRGGHGKHAGAGPGALDVWQVQRNATQPIAKFTEFTTLLMEMMREERELEPGVRVRARTEPPPYVGKHRLVVPFVVETFHPRVKVLLGPGVTRPH
ncbi:hypothetical protein [Saccharopolyspora dendranthemae]|uniref:Uncharacterized protein n=1 Tax=Saccharopolyspora dendranthemae TaxID=1181886 RepID=A0A561U5I1_9PSEU|nr:hypothetical protein [Saccharopolyspora dendranthemae]TWF94620.1 hypothetical protein FHU35_13335 [Saccharopolyspora dendranthemae]